MSIRIASFVLVAASLTASANAELVVNGDFGTGDFTGWNLWGDTSFTGVDGNGVAYLGSVSSYGGIYQDVATVVGQQYTFSFDLQADADTPNGFYANFGSSQVMSFSDTAGFGWTHFSYDVVATESTTRILFGSFQVPAYNYLDNVSLNVAPVPAPGALALLGVSGLAGTRRRRA